jgi:O-antigen ligase
MTRPNSVEISEEPKPAAPAPKRNFGRTGRLGRPVTSPYGLTLNAVMIAAFSLAMFAILLGNQPFSSDLAIFNEKTSSFTNFVIYYLIVWPVSGLAGAYIFGALLAKFNIDLFLDMLKGNISILIVYLYALFSVSYSADKGISLYTWLALFQYLLIGVAFLYATSNSRLALDIPLLILISLVVISYALVIAVPSIGIHSLSNEVGNAEAIRGSWKGLFFRKNTTGAVLMLPSAILLARLLMRFSWQDLAVLLLTCVFLWFSRAKTAYAALGLALILWFFLSFYAARANAAARFIMAFLLVAAFASYNALMVYYLNPSFGLDATNRVIIWQYNFMFWREAMWQGHGYAGVYVDGAMKDYVNSWVAQNIDHAHSGYMEILGQLGIAGSILAGLWMLLTLMNLMKLMKLGKSATTATLSLILFSCLTHALTEPDFFSVRPIWFVMALVTIIINSQLYVQKLIAQTKTPAPVFPFNRP